MKRLRLHRGAQADLEDAFQWHRAHSPRAARRLRAELRAALLRVRRHPKLWPKHESGVRRCKVLRFPFHVVYVEAGNHILVLAVAHGRRRPGYWLRRG